MAGMRLLPVPPPRRATFVALVAVAGFCLTLVGLALTNPWRLTALYPVATTGGTFATLTLAGALAAAAALLATASPGRRALVGLMVALVAVPALCVGLPAATLDGALRDRQVSAERVLATSPGGGYSLVGSTYPDGTTEVFVRSRRGLLSREAATPVARCSHDPFEGELPLESVRFTDEHRVAVPVLAAGITVTVAFDAGSLAPELTVDMCEI